MKGEIKVALVVAGLAAGAYLLNKKANETDPPSQFAGAIAYSLQDDFGKVLAAGESDGPHAYIPATLDENREYSFYVTYINKSKRGTSYIDIPDFRAVVSWQVTSGVDFVFSLPVVAVNSVPAQNLGALAAYTGAAGTVQAGVDRKTIEYKFKTPERSAATTNTLLLRMIGGDLGVVAASLEKTYTVNPDVLAVTLTVTPQAVVKEGQSFTVAINAVNASKAGSGDWVSVNPVYISIFGDTGCLIASFPAAVPVNLAPQGTATQTFTLLAPELSGGKVQNMLVRAIYNGTVLAQASVSVTPESMAIVYGGEIVMG